jgi:pSer/pThr/pTyr-binding forkhead associated (FHA) protein
VSLSLIVVDGPDQGRRFEVAGVLVLGRDASAGIVIADPEVSRRHASLTLTGDELEVEDLGSRNGTWVSGERIDARRKLSEGDKLRVGKTVLKVAGPPADTVVHRKPDAEERAFPEVPDPGGPTEAPEP